jgi:hypothetical protein
LLELLELPGFLDELPDPFDFERDGQSSLLFTPTRHAAIWKLVHGYKIVSRGADVKAVGR